MKKTLNKININSISAKLTLGISSIVFLCTLLVGSIFLTQYRNLSLKNAETDLMSRAHQIEELGEIVLSSNEPTQSSKLFDTLKDVTDFDFWIISNNGDIFVSTTDIPSNIQKINMKYIKELKENECIITYNYSSYFTTKVLTVITPVVEDNKISGAIILHKDVNIIYRSNDMFILLIFISLIISLLLSLALSIIYSRYFTKPIKRITEVTKQIAKSNYDIKTNIKMDDEIGELANTIDDMAFKINKNINEIIELEHRAKELVANVSHEFKTPLTLIRGYVENIQDKTTKPTDEIYNKILNNTNILEHLINELLDLSRFQAGNVILNKEDIHLKQLIKDIIDEMNILANKKDISIKLIEKYKKEQIISADYVKIRQLITIFLDNAVKYSNNNSEIKITLYEKKIVILDNGIGIEKSKFEQLFDRYYQINNSKNGYGLGLCIAKYIADAHNYKINIDSEVDKGTTVEIDL